MATKFLNERRESFSRTPLSFRDWQYPCASAPRCLQDAGDRWSPRATASCRVPENRWCARASAPRCVQDAGDRWSTCASASCRVPKNRWRAGASASRDVQDGGDRWSTRASASCRVAGRRDWWGTSTSASRCVGPQGKVASRLRIRCLRTAPALPGDRGGPYGG
jgi:hypothetical protein